MIKFTLQKINTKFGLLAGKSCDGNSALHVAPCIVPLALVIG